MKRTKRHLALMLVATALSIGMMTGCSAPLSRIISQQEIPSGIPADVRTEIERLYDYSAEVRLDAAQRLGRMGERAVPAIKFLLATVVAEPFSRGVVAIEAARAVLNTGRQGEAALISALTKNPAIAIELGMTRHPRAVDVLIAALGNPDPGSQLLAAWGLSATQDPRAVDPLIRMLGNPDAVVRVVAGAGLIHITKQDFGVDQKKWQAWWEQKKGTIQKPTELAAQKPSERDQPERTIPEVKKATTPSSPAREVAVGFLQRGVAHGREGQYDMAWRLLTIAIGMFEGLKDPDLTLAYYNRGVAFALSGDAEKAREDFAKVCNMGDQDGCKAGVQLSQGQKPSFK